MTTVHNPEVTKLEACTAACSLRYLELELRVGTLEDKVGELILKVDSDNRIVIRTLMAVVASIVTLFVVIHFKII